MIKFKNISFGYKKKSPVFNDLSFSINRPQHKGFIVGLMGDSGSGKSTLLKLLLGTEKMWSGTIEILPQNPTISYVPQDPIMFEHLSPLENAMFFNKTERYRKLFDTERFNEMVKILGKKNLFEKKSVNELSGGEKQIITLLRALSVKPDILLLDEPLTGMDEKLKNLILTTILLLSKKHNILTIYVTHHRQEIELIADHILYLIKDEKKKYVSEVFLDSPSVFLKTPPTISALYMSKNLETIIFPVKIDHNGKLILCNKGEVENDRYDISVSEKSIFFADNDGGWRFTINDNTKSDKFIFLQLTDNNEILPLPILKSNLINERMQIVINGYANFYHNGRYEETKRIINNKVL